ncbi:MULTISPECIES: amidase [Rhodonellum]|nr:MULTISPECIES: amidase family protein [Rhodonellum]SDZ32361.1 Asp-tRNAAsn/Glu-tRNAGln amidotransferase A subunit [Rhodonellum ikkaensis]
MNLFVSAMNFTKKIAIWLLTLSPFFGCESPKKESINLSELTISDIHKAYQSGKFNSQELVQAYLDRIENMDSAINSISMINPEALQIAKALDEEFQQTKTLRPLHGIPLIVKDNINTKGLPTTAGSLALQDFYPEEDAFIIQKLVAAGAIVIAKSNMAEWAFSPMHSESSTVGITRNPYNLDHVPAGSSGGTGASIASNFGTIGLGTDTGNSIRGPSSHNALVGFRTTLGLVSREGIVPLYLRNDVVGPMCRTVEDAVKMLEVIAGFDAKDPLTRYSEGRTSFNYTQYLDKDGLKGARIGVLKNLLGDNMDEEVNILFEKALSDMANLGAAIEYVEIPDFDQLSQDQWCPTFRVDLEDFLKTYVKRDTTKTLEDIMRIGTHSAYTKGRMERLSTNTLRRENPALPCGDAYTDLRRVAFREAIEKKMEELQLDALVYPTWNNKPARIDFFEEEYKGDNSQIVSPHTGQPAFTVPMGFTSGNLPAGLQFLGRMYDEPVLIKLTYSYEQGTKHRKSPN